MKGVVRGRLLETKMWLAGVLQVCESNAHHAWPHKVQQAQFRPVHRRLAHAIRCCAMHIMHFQAMPVSVECCAARATICPALWGLWGMPSRR